MWTPVEQQVLIRSATICLFIHVTMETSHWLYFTKIQSSAFSFFRSPTWRFHHCVVMCEGSDCQSCGGPRQRWPPSIPPSLPPSCTFLISTSLRPPCVFGWLHLTVSLWGTAVFLTGQIKTGDWPQGAWGCEASDTSRKSRVSHLHCAICAQQWERQWGVRMNIPQAVLTHKPQGFAWRIILCCYSLLTSELSTSAKRLSFHPWWKEFLNPNLSAIKVFRGRLLA